MAGTVHVKAESRTTTRANDRTVTRSSRSLPKLPQRANLRAVIATYNRSKVLSRCLNTLVRTDVGVIIVDDSANFHLTKNLKTIYRLQKWKPRSILHIVTGKKNGSTVARNIGLDMANRYDCQVLLIDDDMEIASTNAVNLAQRHLRRPGVGIVGVRLLERIQTRTNKPFYLNHAIADYVSRLTGFVFLNITDGPRWAEFVPAAMFLRKELAATVRYDTQFSGNAYREESDLQQQARSLGWKILFDPSIVVNHWGQEAGGNRGIPWSKQMYWRSRNHTYFLRKHFRGLRLLIYVWFGLALLCAYRPTDLRSTLKGLNDGFRLPIFSSM